jgi:hypothetical protein
MVQDVIDVESNEYSDRNPEALPEPIMEGD